MPHDHRHDDDHDRGLTHDLRTMAAMVERRRALKWFAGAGTAAVVAGCSGGGTSDSATTVVTGSTATPAPTSSATPTPTPTPTSAGSCIADPSETNGPYPADGTNVSSGATSNALTSSGIIRSDIRASFIGSTTVAGGVKLTITLRLVNVNAACSPLLGYAVYIWQSDRSGNYSLYTIPAESYLRGVQVTDAAGQVTFTTIFPGCYPGRWPHIHFEIFSSQAAATSGRYAVLISQLALPASVCSTVYADAATYPDSMNTFNAITLASDLIFRDNTAAQIAQQTPTMSGSVAAGYTATAVIGLAL